MIFKWAYIRKLQYNVLPVFSSRIIDTKFSSLSVRKPRNKWRFLPDYKIIYIYVLEIWKNKNESMMSKKCSIFLILYNWNNLKYLEMFDWNEENENSVIYWVGLAAAVILLFVNLPLVWIVKRTWNSSLINQFIGLDCLVALLHIPFILQAGDVIDTPCWFRKDAHVNLDISL